MKKVYILGPMRGKYLYNFPAFDAAEELLRDMGFDPLSPARMERDEGFNPEDLIVYGSHSGVQLPWDWDSWNPEKVTHRFQGNDIKYIAPTIKNFIQRDISGVLDSDGVYALKGWEDSTGARAEMAVANWAGKFKIYE